jgi:FlaA1/EpsC-like NDP-sugar epimerase
MQRFRKRHFHTQSPEAAGGRVTANPAAPGQLLETFTAGLSRISPRLLIWVVQLAIFAFSGYVAFLLRFDFSVPRYAMKWLGCAVPLWILAKCLAFRYHELDRGWWRHTSVADVMRSGMANLAGSAMGAALILAFAPAGFPRSVYLLDLLVCIHASLGIRLFVRMVGDVSTAAGSASPANRVLIYGAGSAGIKLLRELRTNSRLNYEVCGFLDDHQPKVGMSVDGMRVLGSGDRLAALIAKHGVAEVLIAIPSADGRQMARILELCRAAGVRCKTVPGLAEIISGSAPPVRDVAVEDLLGRSVVQLDIDDIREKLEGEVVMITGAAGSIGSELCRQVARANPRAIVAFEAGETPLFHIAQEMRERFPDTRFHAEIGNIQNRRRLAEVFAAYGPSVVYHAAAYKHVPLMESNIFEAVENNVLGTFTLATTAAEYGVGTFVMISSDKAVSPTNVMGVTKRVAELLIRSLQNRGTQFVSVRFGNVLGSQGSVVPHFKKQIAAGGPVTVTHPDMCRYFMTIPEAVQLVLQASTMGRGGEIFVLDMGQPVKIVDLARNLIQLSGLRPDIDIQIRFTGIRPGEKLYEELNTLEEQTLPTCHEKIKVFAGNGIPERMTSRVSALREYCEMRDRRRLILELKDIVPEYSPSAEALPELVVGLGKRLRAA